MKILLNNQEVDLLIGMDAEFFLKNSDGRFIAAARVIPGLKTDPHKLQYGVCHPDGLSLEVGAPPSDTPMGMIKNLFAVLGEVQELYLNPNRCTIAYTEAVPVNAVDGVQPEDLVFGCGSEFDAYNSTMYKASAPPNQENRYSGFHIHLGFTKDQESNVFTYRDMSRLVKALDVVFEAAALNTTAQRAVQYGGRGAFRVKPYGIEYRMMDCTVVTDKARLTKLLGCLEKLPEIFKLAHQYAGGSTVTNRLHEIGRTA